ncbi:sodium:calcium antiporter [Patescibacteria group bacterium]
MTAYILFFIIGVVILLYSTHFFVRQAEKISHLLRISPLIVGSTIVAFGTSLPELAVSLTATINKDIGLAMGNIVGSNITNVFLILPVGILVGKLRIGTTKTQRNAYLMIGITALFIFLYLLGVPGFLNGIVLLTAAVFVTLSQTLWGISGRSKEDAFRYKKPRPVKPKRSDYVHLTATVGGIISGGILTVMSIERIAEITGYSTTMLGLSVTAIATSLPELLTTIFSQRYNDEKIAIGDIIGSNIYNLSLVGGIVLLVSTWETLKTMEGAMLIFATGIFSIIIVNFKGKIVPKKVGYILFGLYALYFYLLRGL